MPWREKFEINGIYHLYNRGVEKIPIFRDDFDRVRFLEILDEFNYEESFSLSLRQIRDLKKISSSRNDILKMRGERLIKLVSFCLMPNHYHLLARQCIENGVTKFMRKVNTGYAKYFNSKHERSGGLFQNRFKSVKMISDAQLIHTTEYIHLNPLKILPQNNNLKANEKLEKYIWSSFKDFVGLVSYPDICMPEIIKDLQGGINGYKGSINAWAKRKDDQLKAEIGLQKTGFCRSPSSASYPQGENWQGGL